jgi:hypothetical protein
MLKIPCWKIYTGAGSGSGRIEKIKPYEANTLGLLARFIFWL